MLGRLERYRVYTGEEYKINQAGRGGDIYVIIFVVYAYPTPPKIKPRWPLENCTSAGCDLVSGTGLVTKITQPARKHNS